MPENIDPSPQDHSNSLEWWTHELVEIPRKPKNINQVLQILNRRYRVSYGGVRVVWVVAMFDLPTDSSEFRRRYAKFRKFLLDDGFHMMQYSVYGRSCPNRDNAETHMKRIEEKVPNDGQVRVFTLTALQMERMKIFSGKSTIDPESEPDQLTFW